ncbi:MAG: alpha/beta fold hydrolase [Verrucomicrobiales bacterium]
MEPLLRLCGVYLLLLPPRPPEELLAKVRKVAREMNVTVMVRRLGAVINADDAEEFRKIKCPSLYLRGAKDRLIPPANAEFMQ